MASYDVELSRIALRLGARPKGQRGKLPTARIRRSISTTYYALFHFLLEEIGNKTIGSKNELRFKRRVLARSISHKAIKTTMEKLRGNQINSSVKDFFKNGPDMAPPAVPKFAADLANAFIDAQAKRNDADYDLNKPLSEADAKILWNRVKRVIPQWRAANTAEDRDFKRALCLLIILKGQLRADG
ncbi:MAG: hypothetical protein RL367_1932 [Pseudomonadota bacterium]